MADAVERDNADDVERYAESADNVINNETEDDVAQARDEAPISLPRTSTRASHPPAWMKDYVTTMKGSKHPYSMTNYVSYKQLSTSYKYI